MIGTWGHRVVQVDGLRFGNRAGVGDGSGGEWVLSKIEGWDSSPSVRRDDTPYPQGHGSFSTRGYRTGRSISLDGAVLTGSREHAARIVETLAAILAEGGFGRLEVTDDDQATRWCTVQTAAQPVVDWSIHENVISYGLELWAPDPVKYGLDEAVQLRVASGSAGGLAFDLFTDGITDTGWLEFGDSTSGEIATIDNQGTATTWPRFEVAGPCDGFEIVESITGSRLVYSEYVPAGSVLTIDSHDGAVLLDATADRSAALTVRQWWDLPPGVHRVVRFSPVDSTDAVLTVTYNSGWW